MHRAGISTPLPERSEWDLNALHISQEDRSSRMQKKVVIIGPAHPLRGGLASFDHRLCQQFLEEGHNCVIFSFSLLYPGFLFPGTSQFTSEPPPPGLTIYPVINSVHPLNWWQIGRQLKKMRPDIILVRYWLPFMGPALGTILRIARQNRHTRVIALTDNILPHEKRPGDHLFTRYFLSACTAFVTMSEKVLNDLRTFETRKTASLVAHPLYDNFGEAVPAVQARQHLGLPAEDKLLLFFGFIRPYKGLDLLIQSLKLLKDENYRPPGTSGPLRLRAVIAGEFYENARPYLQQISESGLEDWLILRTDFIPDSDVKYYFCAADVVVQPYRQATQSGVTPLAYHFEKPMIVTRVGSLEAMVPHEKVGLVCSPDPVAFAESIKKYFELGASFFLPQLREEKKKYSWSVLVNTVLRLAEAH